MVIDSIDIHLFIDDLMGFNRDLYITIINGISEVYHI